MVSDEQRIESEATTLAALAASEQWKLAKQRLIERIRVETSLLDMSDADRRNPVSCEGRYIAAQIVAQWIADVDGEELLHATIQQADEQPHVLRTGIL